MARFGDPNPTIRLRQHEFMGSVFHDCALRAESKS